ncbi:MAG: hypothetical protein Q7R40_17195 [Phaeospirillum sp.]|nr:hypothetical protein [Phaeospirillum sp.]
MKQRLGLIAVALWLVTAVAMAVVFVRGNTAPGSDGRTALLLQESERNFVLAEMRSLLVANRTITAALAAGDAAQVAKAARAVGMAEAHDRAPSLLAKLPLDFKRLAMAMHGGFDGLAAEAEAGAPMPALTARLLEQLDRCIACHEGFRIDTPR